ncbi:MAG: PQQ-dependent sugar dehydrogenase [Rubrivivax sp.]|nr:PQQ-dependent sugar dehydrogenase [Rubrivivax sp.]
MLTTFPCWRHAAATLALLALPLAATATLQTTVVASGLSAPVAAAQPLPGGPLYVVELGGRIKVVAGGVVSNFLTIPVATGGEQGLLGLAFDPGYADPASAGYRRFFVNYIDPTSRDTIVASYRATSDLLADPASRVEVIRVDQPTGRSNHKAGWIGFKPGDANNLYIATGDGGSGNDPDNFAQNRNVLLGKMLRIDINRDDFAADPLLNYAIPADNPFVGVAGVRAEIYAYGLRNPFRNGFDSATGNLWIADVGQSAREEINFIAASSAGGQNFGWRVREGDIATPSVGGPLQPGMVDPVLVYNRSFGFSITGGHVVHSDRLPGLDGQYIFADYGSDRIWSRSADGSLLSMASTTNWTSVLNAGGAGTLGGIVGFGEGATGELFIVEIGGRVVQVVPEPASVAMMLAGTALLLGWRARSR